MTGNVGEILPNCVQTLDGPHKSDDAIAADDAKLDSARWRARSVKERKRSPIDDGGERELSVHDTVLA